MLALTATLLLCAYLPCFALEVELDDIAPDRVERQRAYTRGQLPLAGTPDLARLDERLAAKGLAKGRPVLIRIFKASSELEIWMQPGKDKPYVLLDSYPICHWTGTLGPKLREGDRQSPEGFYNVSIRQMRLVGRWQKAFNIGFPNPHDQLNKRTGSFILVHGGCSSVGCFAMTEQVQEEIFELAKAAVTSGQERFHVHIFPFRMSEENLALHAGHTWAWFWRDLKAGSDSFERTGFPPKIAICEQRYHVTDGEAGDAGDARNMSILRPASAGKVPGAAPVCITEAQRASRQTVTVVAATAKAARPSVAGETDEETPASTRKPLQTKRGSQQSRSRTGETVVPPAAPDAQQNGLGSSLVTPSGG